MCPKSVKCLVGWRSYVLTFGAIDCMGGAAMSNDDGGGAVTRYLARKLAPILGLDGADGGLASGVHHALMDNRTGGFLVVDRGGKTLSANGAAVAMLGSSVVSLGIRKLLAPESEALCGIHLDPISFAGHGSHFEGAFMAPGGVVWMSVSVLPIRLGVASGGAAVVFHDVTPRRLKEEELSSELHDAKRRLVERDEFLSIAAHELRAPVSAVGIETEIITRALAAGDETASDGVIRSVRAVGRQMGKLSRLVANLFDTSKLVSGAISLTLERADLTDIVRSTVYDLSALAASGGCELTMGTSEAAVGHWDREVIGRIVTNIVCNAIQYGAGRPILVRVERADHAAVLTVEDHGCGIDPSHHDAVFEKFRRLRVGERLHRGLGLGLWIVRELCLLHGGGVSVKSAIGAGATFVVKLPCSD